MLRREFLRLQQETHTQTHLLQQTHNQDNYKRQLLADRHKRIQQQQEERRHLEEVRFNPLQTLEHKTSHKSSRINELFIDVWFVMIGQYLKIWNLRVQKNLNIEKIIFKVVQRSSEQCILLIKNIFYDRKCTKYINVTRS